MAHARKRFLEELVQKTLGLSSLVGILGHRQVGKTTFLQQLSSHYSTFDDKDTLTNAKENPKQFLKSRQELKHVLDEAQLVPDLFPALKERVRKDKRPGQFLLSGSVRFTSRKAIRESLTGRIINLELLPFTLSELQHRRLPDLAIQFIKTQNCEGFMNRNAIHLRDAKSLNKEVEVYFKRGGLPGICFIRDARARSLKISEQMATILDRDLRLVYPSSLPYSQILDYVRALAIEEGMPIRYSYFEKQVKISEATQKKLLIALEAIFLIRLLPIEGGRRGHILYFEDQAEVEQLAHRAIHDPVSFEGLIFRNLRAQWVYRPSESFRFFHYFTRAKARVPICCQTDSGILGVLPITEETPNRSEIMTAGSFLKSYSNSKIMYIAQQTDPQVINSRSVLLPLCAVV